MTSEAFQQNADNFCYRHPDRQSFVLCQRCLRTICGECQTPAAVGVVCPECMKAQQKARTPVQRKAQRRWGRSQLAPVALSDSRPLATFAIMAVTALVFLITLIPGAGDTVQAALAFYAPTLYPDFGAFQPWRLLSVALVHSGFLHLGLNMLALWMVGRSLEPLLGRFQFVGLYLLCTLGGSVSAALLSFDTPVVGASGAVFGLFGALLIIGRHLGANVAGIAVVIGINLAVGFIWSNNISWQAHVGGLVTGLLAALILVRTSGARRRGSRLSLQIVLSLGLLALLLIPPALYW